MLALLGATCLSGSTVAAEREVRVGVYENPPKIQLGRDGQPSGIFGELLQAIAREEGWKLRTISCEWQECLEMLKSKRIDLLPDVAYSEERSKLFDFHSIPALNSWSAIYVPADASLGSVFELKNKKIAVLEGSVQESYLRQLLADFDIRAVFVPVKSFDEGFAKVAAGQADAAAANHFFGETQLAQYRLTSTPIMFQPARLYYATPHATNADLLSAIDKHLHSWKGEAGSPYFRMVNKWVSGQPTPALPSWWGWAVGGLAFAIAVTVLFNLFLQRQLRRQTAQLKADMALLNKAEVELTQQRSLFRSLIQNIPDPVWLKDPEGTYIACNLRFEEFFGARESDIVGKTDYDFVDHELADFFRTHDRAAMDAGRPYVNEEWLTFAVDGYRGLFETTKTPMAGADGHIIGVLGIAHDITERMQAKEALTESEARFRRLVENAPDVLYRYSIKRGGLYYSPQVEKIFGHTREYLYEHPFLWAESIHEEDRDRVRKAVVALQHGTPFELEYRVRDAAGQWRCILDRSITSQQDADDMVIEGLAMDITDRKQQDKKLAQLNDSLEATLNAMPDQLFELDAEGRYLVYRSRHKDFLDVPPETFIGKTFDEVLPPEMALRCKQAIELASKEGFSTGTQIVLDLPNGRHWFELSIARKPDNEGSLPHFIVISRDISERKHAEALIEHMAYHDQLTRLPNRTLFIDRLRQALASARRRQQFGAVLFVDLDQFKHINDVYGHLVGDKVLQYISQLLSQHLRQDDTVGRFGGDEFVVLLPELSADQAQAATAALSVGEKLRARIERPILIEGQAYHTTASIGVSLFPKQGEREDDLIREADIAMYRAKTAGRNTLIFFEQDMQAAIANRYTMEQDLREAIHQGDLKLYLQSQVNALGEVVGAEALVRWQHPVRGLIEPAAFIPLAEETGLILSIGDWVLREACSLIAHAGRDGIRLHLAVNVSPRQFHQANFVTQVSKILADTGADAALLTLEITENLLLNRADDVVSRMRALAELGIHFSIDDFGTGYSSLAYLKRLPLNELKIDKSFVQDLPQDLNDATLVETILSMARHMDFKVVAEGVETDAQFAFLTQHECTYFQGYLFSRPLPPEDWLALLPRNPG